MNEADTMYSFSGLEKCDKTSITCSENCTMTVSGLSLREGNVRLKATVTTTDIKSGSTVQLPVYYFPGYHLLGGDGNEIEIQMAEDGRIAYIPTEGTTTITLYYAEAKLWYLADIISLATAVFALIVLLHKSERFALTFLPETSLPGRPSGRKLCANVTELVKRTISWR